ncbi:MAG TPA: glycosyltransferase [Chloroflexota bacterium]|nr:glycosyltransferase [Chloroflexota bacterium]
MKTLILTIGSRGDVQPYVALGKGLQAAGHNVTICTGNLFQEMVEAHQLPFLPMDDEMIRLTETPEGKAMIEGGGSAFKAISLVKPMIARMVRDAWAAAQSVAPDVIIYHPKTLSGYHIGEKLGIPIILTMALPMYTPTRAFPLPITNFSLGGWFNRLTYQMVPMISAPYADVIGAFRQELGLPKRGRFLNETRLPDGRNTPTLYGISHHLIPRPADWADAVQASGYWFLAQSANWQPPDDLAIFLQAGPPPVYIGFGSMAGKHPDKLAAIAVAALQQAGQRGILATGWGGLQPGDLPDTIFQLKEAPHDWLFPQMAAVVHHGGAGTTAAGLRAGKATLICPFLGDQPFWGERMYQLGVGPKPIPQKKLTADNLAAALTSLVNDPSIQQKAASLGQKLRAEDGIGAAVTIVEKVGLGL